MIDPSGGGEGEEEVETDWGLVSKVLCNLKTFLVKALVEPLTVTDVLDGGSLDWVDREHESDEG